MEVLPLVFRQKVTWTNDTLLCLCCACVVLVLCLCCACVVLVLCLCCACVVLVLCLCCACVVLVLCLCCEVVYNCDRRTMCQCGFEICSATQTFSVSMAPGLSVISLNLLQRYFKEFVKQAGLEMCRITVTSTSSPLTKCGFE